MRYANRSSICSNVILWANFALQTHNKKRIQRETASSICYFEVSKERKEYLLSNFGWYLGSSLETYDTICWSCYFSIDLFLPPSGSLTDVRWPKFVGFSTPELRFSLRTSSLFGQISGILPDKNRNILPKIHGCVRTWWMQEKRAFVENAGQALLRGCSLSILWATKKVFFSHWHGTDTGRLVDARSKLNFKRITPAKNTYKTTSF